MLFWIIAAFLTLAACLIVMLPLVRVQSTRVADAEYDVEVYRDQLAEIEQEKETGLIDAAEAEQARAEIGRRILKADAARRQGRDGRPRQVSRAIGAAAILSVPLISWGLYAAIGSPWLPAQPLHARLEQNRGDGTIAELVARAEAHLAANPDDARGWDVLAPVYLRMGRNQDAIMAFRRSIELGGPNAARETGLGEAITANSGGLVTEEAQAAFERALAIQPGYPRARFLMASGYAQEGRVEEANRIWQAMRSELPPDSPWQPLLAEALGTPIPTASAPGPGQEEVEAAAALSDGERAEMIETMVAGLDQRLRDNPHDGEGWQRLVRSYVVLGREAEAATALERGVAALGSDSPEGRRLIALAQSLGLAAAGTATE